MWCRFQKLQKQTIANYTLHISLKSIDILQRKSIYAKRFYIIIIKKQKNA